MKTANINVKYVNQPGEGKKRGTLKTADGELYGVMVGMLGQFTPNNTYDVTYSERPYNGQIYKTIETAKQTSSGGSSTGRTRDATSSVDAERMFVCSLLNAYIQAGKIDLRSDSVISATRFLRDAWRATFGSVQQSEDLNDEIPY